MSTDAPTTETESSRDDQPTVRRQTDDDAAFWRDLDEIAREINRFWPKGVSAEDAVNDVRRDL